MGSFATMSVMARTCRRTTDIRIATPIKAKPEQVFRALTSARELCAWWLERAETESRNMGRFRMVWPPGRARTLPETRGVFVDLEPGSKVAWIIDDRTRPAGLPALVSFFIEKRGRGSRLTLVHAGFSAAKSQRRLIEKTKEKWEDCLAKLKLYLESGKTCKTDRLSLPEADLLIRRGK